MRSKEAASLFVASLMAGLMCAPSAAADNNLTEQLRASYLNKVVMLRHFYTGDRLSFQADGSLIGNGEVGPWTVDSHVLILGIELHEKSLQIQGRRVCLVFDSKAEPYRDLLAFLDETKTPNLDKLKDYFLNKNVAIEIDLTSENTDEQRVAAAINAIFLKTGESLGDIVPDFWRDYFDRMAGRSSSVPESTDTVYRVTRGGVSPPRVIEQPEPKFSDEARKAGYHGIETLSVIVDASGRATRVMIVTPLGLGLDEKAVEAVRRWKFVPAKKGREPVAVKIRIEVDFNLN